MRLEDDLLVRVSFVSFLYPVPIPPPDDKLLPTWIEPLSPFGNTGDDDTVDARNDRSHLHRLSRSANTICNRNDSHTFKVALLKADISYYLPLPRQSDLTVPTDMGNPVQDFFDYCLMIV